MRQEREGCTEAAPANLPSHACQNRRDVGATACSRRRAVGYCHAAHCTAGAETNPVDGRRSKTGDPFTPQTPARAPVGGSDPAALRVAQADRRAGPIAATMAPVECWWGVVVGSPRQLRQPLTACGSLWQPVAAFLVAGGTGQARFPLPTTPAVPAPQRPRYTLPCLSPDDLPSLLGPAKPPARHEGLETQQNTAAAPASQRPHTDRRRRKSMAATPT